MNTSDNEGHSAPASPHADAELLILASIVRPQGRHGEVLAEILTDFPERFAERSKLLLIAPNKLPRSIKLTSHWLHQGRIVFKFDGIDSMNDAETLRGWDVAIPKAERAPLEEGAVYISDLVGCVLVDAHSGVEVGVVSDVDRESTATALLVVEAARSGEVLVPFVLAFDPKVDLGAKRILMNLPEGLLELNAPGAKNL